MISRVDYFKVRMAVPRSDVEGPFVDAVALAEQRAARILAFNHGGGYRISKDYASNPTFTLYYLELWGWTADSYVELHGKQHGASNVMRIDFRALLGDEVDLKELGESAAKKGRRQYQWFNKRLREKKGDRDAGGFGFAKGSHKSEKRVSVYKRGAEQPAAELQLRGKQAAKFWNEFNAQRESDLDGFIATGDYAHERAIDLIGQSWLEQDLLKECHIDLIALNAHSLGQPYDETETRLATLDALYDELNKNAQQDWLQGKLFGEREIEGV